MKKKTVFWDADTQFDFMGPQGALDVPGTEGSIDRVSEVRRFALENGYSLLDISRPRDKIPRACHIAESCQRP